MNIKTIFSAMVHGAAAALGCLLISEGVKTWRDPAKRATIKKSVRNIKDAFTTKTES